MPIPNSKHLRGLEVKDRRGSSSEKSSSFHANRPIITEGEKPLQRPRTAPELLSGRSFVQSEAAERPRPTKLLLNVSVLGRVGPIHVIISSESTVGDLIAAAVRQYIKEARRPILPSAEPSSYSLHYSQFSLESLDREENLMTLGSRNFLICPRKPPAESSGGTAMSSCFGETETAVKPGFNWLKFMDFLK